MKAKATKSKTKPEPAPAAQPQGTANRQLTLWVCAALAVITFLTFLPVLNNDFVNYDDPDYVTANAHVTSGLTAANIAWAFATGFASNWHPLTWISHMLDCTLFDLRASWHHFVSLVFHIADSLLLFLLLQRLTRAIWPSAVVAALFALHPCHVESVAWISERKDVLSAFFGLLAIWAYAGYSDRTVQREKRGTEFQVPSSKFKVQTTSDTAVASTPSTLHPSRSALFYALSLVLFTLGLMSKPMLVTWPFVLLLLDFWPLRRFGLSPLEAKALPRLILEKVPFFLLSVASSVVTFLVQRKGGAVSTSISLPLRIDNAVVAYARYVADLFWPHDLAVLYPHPGHWPVGEIWASAALLVVITVVVLFFGRAHRYLITGWFWFLGTLVPVIGLVQVGVQSMADRYTYLPYIGLFVIIAWALYEFISRKAPAGQEAATGPAPRAALISGVLLIVLLTSAFASNQQARLWHDSETLFRHAAKVTKNNYLAYNNLGFYLSNRGNTEEAIENYKAALRIKPDYDDALNNLGYALAAQKHYKEAIDCYDAALRIKPDHIEVHNNLGNALSDIGRIDDAVTNYQFVLKRKPDHADAHNNYGVVLAMRGQYDDAIHHFREALRYKPGYASAHSNLGNTYAVQHKLDQAIAEYQESLKLNPDDPQAHNNLGNVLAEQGKLEQATEEYRKALILNQQNPEAHFNLAMALLRQSRREEAAEHFRKALEFKPDYAEAANQLRAITNR